MMAPFDTIEDVRAWAAEEAILIVGRMPLTGAQAQSAFGEIASQLNDFVMGGGGNRTAHLRASLIERVLACCTDWQSFDAAALAWRLRLASAAARFVEKGAAKGAAPDAPTPKPKGKAA